MSWYINKFSECHTKCLHERIVIEPEENTKESNEKRATFKLFVQRHSPTRAGKLITLTDVFQFIMPNICHEKRTATNVTEFIVQSFTNVEIAFEKAIEASIRKIVYKSDLVLGNPGVDV